MGMVGRGFWTSALFAVGLVVAGESVARACTQDSECFPEAPVCDPSDGLCHAPYPDAGDVADASAPPTQDPGVSPIDCLKDAGDTDASIETSFDVDSAYVQGGGCSTAPTGEGAGLGFVVAGLALAVVAHRRSRSAR